jgi:hypothetical protein
MTAFSLQESDVPKLRTEADRFVAGFGSPILEIESPAQVGATLAFGILNHTTLPFVQNVGVRFFMPQGESWASGKDPILFFGRDEWQVSIPQGATKASIRVSLWPFENALDEKVLDLAM